jgi:hypothetical protein
MSLEREMATYERKLPEFLREGREGKYVLIQGEEVLGFYDNLDQALTAGYERSLSEPFLAREIREQEKVLYFTRDLGPCRT